MDHWILALRGGSSALSVANGLLGSSTPVAGPVVCHDVETVHAHTLAELLLRLRDSTEIAVGVALESGSPEDDARERAMALALGAPMHSVLVDRAARERLEGEVLFVKATPRKGWHHALSAVELAAGDARRTACWEQVRRLLVEPPLVARARELSTLRRLAETPGPIVLRADAGMGARRLLREVAIGQQKSWYRVTPRALQGTDAEVLARLEAVSAPWLLLDPVPLALRDRAKFVVERLGRTRVVLLRVLSDVSIAFVPAGRQLTLTPLRAYDARRLLRSMLGPRVTVEYERRLLRRAGAVPRRLVECVRAAVQVGELRYEDNVLVEREPRPLRLRKTAEDPLALRLGALPGTLLRALRVLQGIGDGAPEREALAALHGLLGENPERLLASLGELGLVALSGGALVLGVSLTQQELLADSRVKPLEKSGALVLAAQAAESARAHDDKQAATHFAAAAHAALASGLKAVALRFAVAALRCAGSPEGELATALEEVAAAVGPAVQFELPAHGASAASSGRRKALTLDGDRLTEAAAQARERNDLASAARLDTLAELVKGNTAQAQKLVHDGGVPMTGRDQLVAAMAHGAAGELARAVRMAASALVGARRDGARDGEAAALAVLSALYRSAGREDEAAALADGAQRLRGLAESLA